MDSNMMADGVISLDDRPAIAAIDRANKGLDDHEKKTKTVLDRAGREWQVYGEGVVRVSDRGKTSLDRLLQSMEKQAAMAGKSGTDRLIAERDQLIRKWQDEEKAVQAITKAYDKMIAAESGGGGGRWKDFADSAKNFVEQPMQAIKGAAGGLLEMLGPVWAGVSAGVAVLGSVAVAGWEAAKSLANYGLEIKNVELRTGLTTKEVGQFGFAARMAGQDAAIFERMMRGLSQAADENSKDGEKVRKTLTGMGIDLRSVTGEMKPTSQVLLEIAGGLDKLPEGMQRDAAAMDLFKRAGIEAIPVISGLTENVKRAKEMGLGATDEDLKRWEEYHRNITEAEVLWERFTRKIKEPLAAVVTFFLKDEQGQHYTLEDLAKRGVNLGKYAPRTRAQDLAAAKAAGFGNPEAEQWERNIAQSSLLSYIDKVDARQKGDAAVKAFEGSQGLAGQLKKAEDALAAMTKPAVGVSSVKDVADYAAAEKQVQRIKDQIAAGKTAAEQLKQFRTAAAEFEKKGDESELSAIGKIYYQRDLLIAQAQKLKGVEADVAGIRKSADEQAGVIAKKDWEKFEEYDQTRRNEQSRKMASMLGPSKEQLKEWEEGFAAQERIDSINLTSRKDTLNREAGQAQKMVGLSGLTGMDAIRATYQIRIDMAKQLAAVEADRISKQEKGALQAVETAQAQAAIQKEMDEAREDALMKQLELQKQQLDTLKKDTEGLWHTLLTKPQNFPKQLGSTIHEAVIKPVAEGMSAVTANVLKPIVYGADGEGGVAGFFKKAFGGGQQDPMKVATNLNTDATVQNSTKLAILTALLSSITGVAAPAIAAPAGIGGVSLPAISAPAVSGGGSSAAGGFTRAPWSLGGGASWSSMASYPMSVAMGGGAGPAAGGGVTTSADIPALSHAASGRGFLGKILGGGQQGQQGGGMPGIAGMLKGFKGINWGGLTRTPARYTMDADGNVTPGTVGPDGSTNYGGKITGVNGAAGAALAGGGMMLAQQGLLGSSRGTWAGVGEGTAGGAMVGMQMGGPLGAAIGAVAGFGIGLGEKLAGVETPENKAKRLVKEMYGISIDNSMAKQIASLAQQKYANNVSIAVRDPDVRKMLELYAAGTGQKFPLSASTPKSGSLAEQNGNLYQQATYQFGVAGAFQSPLPVMGLNNGNYYPSPGGPNTSGGAGTSISLNINGQPITPEFVADSSMAAQGAGYGRVQQAANMNVPGLMTGT